MINSLRNTVIGVGVGALVVAATPSLALPNLPAPTNHDDAHAYRARAYGDLYGGYAYARHHSYRGWNNPAGDDISGFTRIRPVK
jgi:hypothetical protein